MKLKFSYFYFPSREGIEGCVEYIKRQFRMTDFTIQWKALEQKLGERFGRVPDLQAILFLIGMNEVGFSGEKDFTKEQKQDLMHVATCVLLSQEDYYLFKENDEEGWPHYVLAKELPDYVGMQQDIWLRKLVLRYFEES